ncbi:MAG: hypothetical protein CMK07_07835 [Ponticaulis sp.]|nr:hypothetical protein [Ponticaulis sp.]
MTSTLSSSVDTVENSLDQIERVLDASDWSYERDGFNSVHCIIPTRWGEMGGLFTISEDPEALQFSLTLDVKPTPIRRAELNELLVMINERLWLGHLDFWPGDNLIIFRHTIAMAGRFEPEESEISAIISAATSAIDQFTPSMNYVIWAGKTADQAFQMAMFETTGEA